MTPLGKYPYNTVSTSGGTIFMKKEIHPAYHSIIATCVCGASFAVGSTLEKIRVDICSSCHPFYAGTDKILDIEGRVERFKKRAAMATKAD